ncbi:hypothetical protein SH601_01275 [Gracilibacillus sp. S3-1-1]|uniref:Uncharacterized protein n=1 Tax=Gracilibacillus pellucidus TaxID=3095368 RepID=A0ACC6M0Y9_9BACI|nr:hypothetical protein [Gracilibacillus sp. S3-1-1]MDX8044605.1 hypothetical protein [Gracilibacillus sp. S3-1-1]
MQLTLNDNQKSLTIDEDITVERVIEAINQLIGTELIFSHLIIDNQEIYSDHHLYIERYIDEILQIKVIAKTKSVYINETLLSAEEYLQNALPAIDTLVEQFYQGVEADTWNRFQQMTDGIQWLMDVIATVDKFIERPSDWVSYVEIYQQLESNVAELAEAVENQDTILIVDIVNYEMKPLLEQLQQLLTKTIDQEGSRTNVN